MKKNIQKSFCSERPSDYIKPYSTFFEITSYKRVENYLKTDKKFYQCVNISGFKRFEILV